MKQELKTFEIKYVVTGNTFIQAKNKVEAQKKADEGMWSQDMNSEMIKLEIKEMMW